MQAGKPRGGRRLGRKTSAAASIEPARPAGLQEEGEEFMSLPDEIVIFILDLLDWHGRINMGSVSQRLKTLVNDGPWMRRPRFTLNDLPTAFTTAISQLRSEAVTELDISHYVLANSRRLAAGIRLCKNLVVLRCVHTRLLPATLFLLVRDNLPRLECLYWSVLEEPVEEFPPPRYTDRGSPKRIRQGSVAPDTLTRMYVEVVADPASIAFVEKVLKNCQSLRSLHFHEREGRGPIRDVGCRILYAFRSGTLDDFDDITYTCEYAPSYAFLPADPSASSGSLSVQFVRCVKVCRNATLKLKPERSCNCVSLAELEATPGIKSYRQLTVLIAESGEETISRLVRAARIGTLRYLESLTLMSPMKMGEMFKYEKIRNQAALCNFIRSCVALTELNLSVFHFREDFNCCSVIATGGLDNLRSLAIVPCALCNPKRLELFSRASFKLRELDIRSGLSRADCEVCQLQSTCDDASLASLRLLRHLTRLTLCGLDHTHSLDFLVGCASLLDLRLRNMGMWRPGCRQDMSPIAGLWTQLRTLKLESIYNAIDFTFIENVPVAPKLTRLCLGTVIRRESIGELLPSKLQLICPAASVIHVHVSYLEKEFDDDVFVLGTPFVRGDKIVKNEDELFFSPVDRAWLCICLNYIGAPKQYGIN